MVYACLHTSRIFNSIQAASKWHTVENVCSVRMVCLKERSLVLFSFASSTYGDGLRNTCKNIEQEQVCSQQCLKALKFGYHKHNIVPFGYYQQK